MAIDIGDPNTGSNHRFDSHVIGAGTKHRNMSVCREVRKLQMAISIQVSATDPYALVTDNPAADNVDCIVDTGARVSVFKAEVASALRLSPRDEDVELRAFLDFTGEKKWGFWCRLIVHLGIGPSAIPVPVWFPVEKAYSNALQCYQWKMKAVSENLLGMESVLDKRLLCFTPEYLYAFEHQR